MRVLETTAVYEEGVLKPDQRLDIPERERVKLRIELGAGGKERRRYSPSDLVGVGRKLWKRVDVKAYIREERKSWGR